jgi:hypothetical protein
MLLVMHAADILTKPGEASENRKLLFRLSQRISLWDLTWEKIDVFMPFLQEDLFRETSCTIDGNPSQETRNDLETSSASAREHALDSTEPQ